MFNQQSKLLLSQLVMQLTTIVGIYYYCHLCNFRLFYNNCFYIFYSIIRNFVHRYCVDRVFELNKKQKYFYYIVQHFYYNRCISMVSNHITHHRYPDKEGDSHQVVVGKHGFGGIHIKIV